MSTPANNAAAALGDITRFAEMRKRLWFLLGALVVYRLGTFIPVPGIDAAKFAEYFSTQQQGTILGIFNMFSGGALQRFSILALNVMPYITASIIVQMMSMVVPSWQSIRKEGESGRRKLTQYTRYGTVVLAAFQGFFAAAAIQSAGSGLVSNPGPQFLFVATVSIVAGTMFLMWLGEQVTERGIGNGITMIIVAGIVAGLPSAIGNTFEMVGSGEMSPLVVLLILVIVLLVMFFCVFVERAQRRIQVNYAKRQVGRRMTQGQSTHLPFKLNMAGVIPPIFASSLLVFPATIAQFMANNPNPSWWETGIQKVAAALNYGQPLHVILFALLIVFFAFFYVALVYDARDTAENLKKAGAFIPGIRPGQQTGEYLDKVLSRLTLWGGLYIMAVCLLPEIMRMVNPSIPFQFGGTSLLIIVVGVMDFIAQTQSHLMSHQYEGLMKKANLRGIAPGGIAKKS
jgi:preprotein translocase subunit SecY